MKAPRVFLMVVAIALAAGIGPALTDAADMTAAPLSKAVDALEAATGGKVLEIRFVDEKGHERFESVVAKPDQVIYMAVDPVTENVTKIAIKELPAWMLNWKLTEYVSSIEKATVPLAKAITKAEAMAGAPAIGAGLAKPLSGANQVRVSYTPSDNVMIYTTAAKGAPIVGRIGLFCGRLRRKKSAGSGMSP